MIATLLVCALAFAGALITTGIVRNYALENDIVDVPNARSSHVNDTPRGGGVSIVLTTLSAVAVMGYLHVIDRHLALAFGGGGLAVALVGVMDDLFHLGATNRVVVHFAAAIWSLWQLGGKAMLSVGSHDVDLRWSGNLLSVVALVWMTNLYNFMDGIDGLAGLEGLYVGACGTALLFYSGYGSVALIAACMAAACAGFLVWNWPPAKIFMGDGGSGFLGFGFGLLMITSSRRQPALLWPWVILLLVFILDSTITLAQRVIDGKRWHQPHRDHAYQHAAKLWNSHRSATVAIALINTLWLLPLACVATLHPKAGIVLLLFACLPPAWTAIHYRAGRDILETMCGSMRGSIK